MAERRCIFCGRLTDPDRDALFRLPPDHGRVRDDVYARYLASRGIEGVHTDLPEVCGKGSPEFSEMRPENGKPVLITKTGRSSDTLICPSCHNELFRDTDADSLQSAVFFGMKDSGKTSLILALTENCISGQFSPDDKYRYILNERTYSAETITEAAKLAASGEKPGDLREPAAVYRVPSAVSGGKAVCDVMHDVSAEDAEDEQAVYTAMPFAASAGHYVYCIPADRLGEAAQLPDESADMMMRLEMMKLLSACRFADKPPELDIAVTKLDTAPAEVAEVCGDEETLRNYIFSVYPAVGELSAMFSGVRAFAVSAAVPGFGSGDLAARLYTGIFG